MATGGKRGNQGYLTDNQHLRDWLANGETPNTLGQLIFYCSAVQEYARENQLEYLVPISGSNYGVSDLSNLYQPSFFSHYSRELDLNGDMQVSGLETIAGWQAGSWSFDSPEVRGFYDLSQKITEFFPAGYLGLDREQAQRRFVLGNAAIISSGGWDASGIFTGVASRGKPEDRFAIEITPAPLAMEGERWAEFMPYRASEADFKSGVPMGIYKQSQNFEWALDFLKFLSSQPVNEKFNGDANWLPSVIATEPSESMVPFMPITEGFPGTQSMPIGGVRASIRNVWTAQAKLLSTKDVSYDMFKQNVEELLSTPRIGADGFWYQERLGSKDRSHALDRTLSVEELKLANEPDLKSGQRIRSLFYQSLLIDEGINVEEMWRKMDKGEEFPQF